MDDPETLKTLFGNVIVNPNNVTVIVRILIYHEPTRA